MVVTDPELADRRWPSMAPFVVGQVKSYASQDPEWADSLERGISPPEIMALNGVEAIEIDHQPEGTERWDPVNKKVIPEDVADTLAEVERRSDAMAAELAAARAAAAAP